MAGPKQAGRNPGPADAAGEAAADIAGSGNPPVGGAAVPDYRAGLPGGASGTGGLGGGAGPGDGGDLTGSDELIGDTETGYLSGLGDLGGDDDTGYLSGHEAEVMEKPMGSGHTRRGGGDAATHQPEETGAGPRDDGSSTESHSGPSGRSSG